MTESKEGSKPSRTLAASDMAFPGRLQATPNEDISHFSSADYDGAPGPHTALQIGSEEPQRKVANSRNKDQVSFDGKAVAAQQ